MVFFVSQGGLLNSVRTYYLLIFIKYITNEAKLKENKHTDM